MEVWRDAVGLEERVQVSNLGNVRAKSRIVQASRNGRSYPQRVPGGAVSPWVDKNGYPTISLLMGDRRPKFSVHRLVALAFVDGYAPGLSVNHINCVKTDNRAGNLEWVTLAENTRLQWRDGLVDLRGENQPGSKLSAKQVIYVRRLLARGVAAHTLAVIAGVSPSTIGLIREGARWNHLPDDPALPD